MAAPKWEVYRRIARIEARPLALFEIEAIRRGDIADGERLPRADVSDLVEGAMLTRTDKFSRCLVVHPDHFHYENETGSQ